MSDTRLPDEDEAPRSVPNPPRPGAPLPRIWKTAPLTQEEAEQMEAEEEEAERDPSKRKEQRAREPVAREARPKEARAKEPAKPAPEQPAAPKPKKKKKTDGDGEKKGVLIEETPTLDTHETRQRVRLVVGGIAGVVILGAIIMLFMNLGGGGNGPDGSGGYPVPPGPAGFAPNVAGGYIPGAPNAAQAPAAASNAEANSALEGEALLAFNDAHRIAKKGDGEAALKRLQQLVRTYPKTSAASKAKEAIERSEQGLPLFIDSPVVMADQVETPPAEEPEPVVAVAPEPPVQAGSVAEANVTPPLNPPEPYRDTGLLRPTANMAANVLPEGFRARPEAGVDPSGWPLEITGDKDGAAMVFVPGGTFTMGNDHGTAVERPAHKVTLGAYYIDQHEVTVRQYRLFQNATGHPGDIAAGGQDAASPDLPVTGVTAQDAYAYAQWAGKKLPSEAQWEMAARTIDGRPHPWGPSPADWSRPREVGQVDPVMSYSLDLSPYGVFDLAGNVREWTADWFDPRYFEQFRDKPAVEPLGPSQGKGRNPLLTIKGGASNWSASWRDGMTVTARLPDLGFRCVLPLGNGNAPAAPNTLPAGTPPPVAPTGAPNPATPANSAGSVPF